MHAKTPRTAPAGPVRPRTNSLLFTACLALLGACGTETMVDADTGIDDAGADDAGADVADGSGADAAADSGSDAASDVATDTAPDAAPDADAASDAQPDAAEDGSGDAATDGGTDTGPDVEIPPGCGDGRLQPPEQCDDGNDVDDDTCSNACIAATCGDGVINRTQGAEVFVNPVVTHPNGVSGYVCDDGSTCPELTCDVSDDPFAPEHGICEALGFDRALEVEWGGGAGSGIAPMLHAQGWDCFDFDCISALSVDTAANCAAWEMLASISCDGIVGEECDDGALNGEYADACRSDCTLPFCGDGIADSDEECDDGNTVDDDGCSNTCRAPSCGDGVRNGDEECDDGNDEELDGCRNACILPSCGDGIVSAYTLDATLDGPIVTNLFGATGHVCDDGGTCEGSSCDVSTNGNAPEHGICQALGFDRALSVRWGGGPGESDSVMPHASNWTCSGFVCTPGSSYSGDNCGSGEMLNSITCFRGSTELCDLGPDNRDEPDYPCRTDCSTPRCGDGIADTGEECDDGNLNQVDGCSNICRLPACGDGVVQGDEACDDGNDSDTDACLTSCTRPVCGDAIVSAGETCDEGDLNAEEPDAPCRTDCRPQRCQDGVVDTDEECDDGNADSRDACTALCALAFCGDGIRQRVLGEECDDGNDSVGDGCDLDCLREEGAARGHVVYIGHDFFARSADIDRAITNAVGLAAVSGTVSVLGYVEYADRSAGGEVSNVNAAINSLSAAAGYTATFTDLTSQGALAAQIDAADVLLIYEPEFTSGTTMANVGTAWAPLLVDFLDRGGVVIVCDFSGDAWQLLNASGILPIASSRTVGTETITILTPDDLLAEGLPASYISTNGSRAVTLPAGSEATVVGSGPSGAFLVHLEL